jgi:hypothetical protein
LRFRLYASRLGLTPPALAALLLVDGCGLIADDAAAPSLAASPNRDAGTNARSDAEVATPKDASTTQDGPAIVVMGDADAPALAPERCANATYASAPSGAGCDPFRIVKYRGFPTPCSGPNLGTNCDYFSVTLQLSEAMPVGFDCETPTDGMRECTWVFPDGARMGSLDEPALEAACAITRIASALVVRCGGHGS